MRRSGRLSINPSTFWIVDRVRGKAPGGAGRSNCGRELWATGYAFAVNMVFIIRFATKCTMGSLLRFTIEIALSSS